MATILKIYLTVKIQKENTQNRQIVNNDVCLRSLLILMVKGDACYGLLLTAKYCLSDILCEKTLGNTGIFFIETFLFCSFFTQSCIGVNQTFLGVCKEADGSRTRG